MRGSTQRQQLAEVLLSQILDGTIPVGHRIPTEAELCTAHGLARGTVRQALEQLDRLGMIDRRPGIGTIVIANNPVEPYQPVAESPTDIAALAAGTRLVRPDTAEIVVDATLARRIGARAGSKWFALRGVRVRRDEPSIGLCWSEHFLRADLPRDELIRADFTVEQVAANRVTQTVAAEILEDRVADALAAQRGSPALVITRRRLDQTGALVSAGIHVHPADRFEITATL